MRKHLALLIAGAAVFGVAMAGSHTTFTIDAGGFDFEDADIDTGYLNLDFENGAVVLTLDDQPGGNLPAISVSVPDRDDIGVADLGDVDLGSYGAGIGAIEVVHPAIAQQDVIAAYTQALQTAGFSTSLEVETANVAAYTFDNGSYRLRAVFHNQGGDVSAYLTGL